MLIVHTPHATPRTRYAFGAVFHSVLGMPWREEPDYAAFAAADGPRLWYGDAPPLLPNCAFVRAEGLLHERGLRRVPASGAWRSGLPALFPVSGQGTVTCEDVFALAFWHLSRMEEYLPFAPDAHDRFPVRQSWAAQSDSLAMPLVDLWADRLWQGLHKMFPGLPEAGRPVRVQPTYDIDYAWAYRHKGWLRNLGGAARDLSQGQWPYLGRRAAVLLGLRDDPYYTFDWLDALHESTGVQPVFFWLVADHGPHDKNTSPHSRAMRRLIRRIADRYAIGLHPSYRSFDEPERLLIEKKRLEDLAEQPVLQSRQHYLRFRFPDTPRALLEAGIATDWSLGFAEKPGFRAGTAQAFPAYDLLRETPTGLVLRPFQVMDVTLQTYLQLDPEQAMAKQAAVRNAFSPLGGDLVSIWHNNSFSELDQWRGWRAVYASFLGGKTDLPQQGI